jgi:hypothetical protein
MNQTTPANRFLNNQRLNAFFGPSSTFNGSEPLALTKQRRDMVKGFVDRSPEGSNLASLFQLQQMQDPRENFYLFEDGYHTPVTKQPHHPSFILNDPRKQAVAQAMYPEQQGIKPNLNALQQLLEIIQARK